MSQPRRSPHGQERKRDPERTKERILDAAVVEFAEHGFSGARISAIASRAGVNEQLISYYFDSKEGLYRTLQQRWRMTSADASRPELPIAEVVASFLRLGVEQRSFARLLVWEGMADGDSEVVRPLLATRVSGMPGREIGVLVLVGGPLLRRERLGPAFPLSFVGNSDSRPSARRSA